MDPLTIILLVLLVLILAGWQGVYAPPAYVNPGTVLLLLLVVLLVLYLTGHGPRLARC
jgi:hypothetical protein